MNIKNSIKSLLLLICIAALVIANPGCEKEPQDQQDTSPQKVDKPAITTPDPATKTDDVPETIEPSIEKAPVVVPTHQDQIIPMVSVGPISFGMSRDQIIAALGEPDVDESGIALFYPKSKGLSFRLDPTKGVREISCWSELHPMPFPDGMTTYPGKTKEGIGMNATREEIIAAYGEPDRTSSRGPTEFLDYANLKAQFSILNNKLVSLKLRGG